MLNRITEVEVCDAMDDDSSAAAGTINTYILFWAKARNINNNLTRLKAGANYKTGANKNPSRKYEMG